MKLKWIDTVLWLHYELLNVYLMLPDIYLPEASIPKPEAQSQKREKPETRNPRPEAREGYYSRYLYVQRFMPIINELIGDWWWHLPWYASATFILSRITKGTTRISITDIGYTSLIPVNWIVAECQTAQRNGFKTLIRPITFYTIRGENTGGLEISPECPSREFQFVFDIIMPLSWCISMVPKYSTN